MTNTETLRKAVAQIRNDHGDVVSRNTRDGRRWLPVADWLDEMARLYEHGDSGGPRVVHHALAVARAYLGEVVE